MDIVVEHIAKLAVLLSPSNVQLLAIGRTSIRGVELASVTRFNRQAAHFAIKVSVEVGQVRAETDSRYGSGRATGVLTSEDGGAATGCGTNGWECGD